MRFTDKKQKIRFHILFIIISALFFALCIWALSAMASSAERPSDTSDAPDRTSNVDAASSPSTQPETKAPETETKVPETETKAPETETKAPETETKAPETETKAPETETKAPETGTKAPETETKSPETETPQPPQTASKPPLGYPVPQSTPVDDSFFADAVFIGDSRTQGLQIYGNIKSAVYYADVGLNAATALTKAFIYEGGRSLTIVDALRSHPEYKKIYISFGVNEFWMSETQFKGHYEKLLDGIIAANPNAAVYVQSVFPVADVLIGYSSDLTNDKLSRFNEVLLEIAASRQVNFVDVAEAFVMSDGRRALTIPDDSPDGVHLNTSGVAKLVAYLRSHV